MYCTAFDAGIDVALSMQSEVQSRWRIVLPVRRIVLQMMYFSET
jgi:hypothetical protein